MSIITKSAILQKKEKMQKLLEYLYHNDAILHNNSPTNVQVGSKSPRWYQYGGVDARQVTDIAFHMPMILKEKWDKTFKNGKNLSCD